MARPVRVVLILFISILSFYCLNNCSAENMGYPYANAPHFFAYKNDDILIHLKKAGYSDFRPDEITRNSIGTILYLHNFYRNDKNSLILSISAGGEIKTLVPPSRRAYTNDTNEFVAWTDDIKQGVHFKNGKFRSILPLFGYFGVDPSGQFFFIGYTSGVEIINNETVRTGPIKNFTEIASTDDPNKILYGTDIKVENIFYKNKMLYLFARNYQNVKGPGDYKQHEIICQVLKKVDSMFVLEEEIHIPRTKPSPSPFAVVDLDPWSDNVLLVDVRDMPFSFLTSWYLFDLKTKKMTKIGRARDYGFFLKDDILRHHESPRVYRRL